MRKGSVVVVGSYNVGLSMKGRRFPRPGETFAGDQFFEGPGGKGSNQAIAASCFGAKTAFIGCVGADRYGRDALEMYKKYGIRTETVRTDPNAHTGMAFIMIDQSGQNMIEIVSGANQSLCEKDIDEASATIASAGIVGFQLEGSIAVVDYGLHKARALGVKTLLDPAPATKLDERLYPLIDYIKPNETEAALLTGIEVTDTESSAEAGRWFINRGVSHAIITLGARGSVLVTGKETTFFPAPKVTVADSTGAGDIFSGAFMTALSQDKDIAEAIVFASHAAALSTTCLGVVEAIPKLEDVMRLMARRQERLPDPSGA